MTPPDAPEAQTRAIAIRRPGERGEERIRLFVLGEGAPIEAVGLTGDPSRVDAVFVGLTLPREALQLAPGWNDLVEGGRAIGPHIGEASEVLSQADGTTRWAPIAPEARERHPILSRVRLAPLDAERCIRSGGCLTSQQAADRCALPCPPPAVPDPPIEPACPAGWRREHVQDSLRCVRTSTPSPSCPDGAFAFPGEATCVAIPEAPCDLGPWPADLPDDGRPIVYVRPGAAGGDGSQAAPYGSLGEAVTAAVRPGATVAIAIAAGELVESVQIASATVAIAGLCPEQTVLRSAEGGPVIAVASGRVDLDGMRFESADNAILVGAAASASISRTSIEVRSGAGVLVGAGRVLVRDTRVDGGDFGVALDGAASAHLERVAIAGVRYHGVLCQRGGAIRAAQVFVGPTTEYDGFRIEACELHVERSVVEGVSAFGVALLGPGASGRIEDVVIRAGGCSAPGTLPRVGVWIRDAEHVSAARVSIEDRCAAAFVVGGTDVRPRVQLEDITTLRTRTTSAEPDRGTSIIVTEPATIVVDRLYSEDSPGGVIQTTANVTFDVRDVIVRGAPDPDPRASAFHVSGLSVLSLERAHVAGGCLFGVSVKRDARAELHDVEVRRCAREGLSIDTSQDVTAERVRVVESAGLGVSIRQRKPLVTRARPIRVTDLDVRRTVAGHVLGTGIDIGNVFDVVIERFHVGESQLAGVRLDLAPTRGEVHLRDGEITSNPVGVQLEPGTELGGILERVRFSDNGEDVARPPQ